MERIDIETIRQFGRYMGQALDNSFIYLVGGRIYTWSGAGVFKGY